MRLEQFLNESINDKGIFKAVFMSGTPGAGKAQPLYCNVLTNNGWKKMGDLKIGDKVITPDNKESIITHIHPQGIQEVYEIELFDGRKTYCTKDHLWKIHGFLSKKNSKKRDKNNRKIGKRDWSIRKTSELIEKQNLKYLKNRLHLPLPKSINFNNEITIDPYILGVILGDGYTRGNKISISSNDNYIIKKIKKLLNENHSLNKTKSKYDYTIVGNGKKGQNFYINELKNYKLFGLKSIDKFIPENYKHSSINNRLKLLQGLIDTDGYVSKSGQLYFYSSSKKLINDVMYIIWSLGDNCIIHEKISTLNGKKYKKCYSLTILSHEPEKYVSLKRKKEKLFNINLQKRNKNHHLKCRIKSIKYINNDFCQCITINDPNGLYLTDNFIVTHNSYVITKIKAGTIEPRIVNTDKMTEFFKAYGYEKWKQYKEKIKLLSKKQLINYWNSLLPLWIDGTSSNSVTLLTRKDVLEDIGYDTAMIWVDTPLEDALERAAKRERPVDPEFIKETYERLMKLKSYYASKFLNFTEILNGEGELIDKVIVQAYRKMNKFFLSPLKNPRGQKVIEIMNEHNWKYLLDGVYDKSYLNSKANMWYNVAFK